MIIKSFLFQFVNNYFVLFFLVYARPFNSPCGIGPGRNGQVCQISVLDDLQFQLLVVFTGKTLQDRLKEWYVPLLKRRLKVNKIAGMLGKAMESAGIPLHLITGDEEKKKKRRRKVLKKREPAPPPPPPTDGGADGKEGEEEEPTPEEYAELRRAAAARAAAPEGSANGGMMLGERVKGGKSNGGAAADEEENGGAKKGSKKKGKKGEPTANGGGSSTKLGDVQTISQDKKEAKAQVKAKLQAHLFADEKNVEDEVMMEPFLSTFDEFNELTIQYGYLALFGPAFPLAPLLALINNVVSIRIDAVKFCTVFQRPKWGPAEDIGAWNSVLNVLGILAVLINSTMICFIGSQLANEDELGGPEENISGIEIRAYSQRLWTACMAIEHAVLLMRALISQSTPDHPKWIDDAKDVLDHRVEMWEDAVERMQHDDATIEEIHDAMNDVFAKRKVKKVERMGMMQSAVMMPLKLLPGSGPPSER